MSTQSRTTRGAIIAGAAFMALTATTPAKADFFRDLERFDFSRLEDGLTIRIDACVQAGPHNRAVIRQDADINIAACLQAGDRNDLQVIQNGGLNLTRFRQRGWRR